MKIDTLYQRFLECSGVTTDTRDCPPDSLFIALKGTSFNGNAFAVQALEKGCRYALVDEAAYADPSNPRIILVDDCLKTLQILANYHRRRLGTRIIGITGTNGKTTTKELIAAVLSRKYSVLYTQGNLNNHIGVPLTLLRLKPEHELAVVEMGANHPGEIKTLVELAEPDYGLITNVGKAHLEGFGSFEGVIRTKGEMYDYLRHHGTRTVFLHHENPWLNGIAAGLTCVRYGAADGLAVSGSIGPCAPFLSFTWTDGAARESVETHLIGAYNLDNMLAAAAVGRYFEVPAADISQALADYQPQNNRSQLRETADNHLIVDAYNANPTSMMAALKNFRLMEVKRKIAVLGDMKELGETSVEEHRKIIDYLKECGFDRVLLVGPEFAKCDSPFEHYPDAAAAMTALQTQKPSDAYILIKGSNSMKLVTLVGCL